MIKNIIICCDGTGNEYGKANTNVVKLFNLIVKDNKKQIAFYDPGVGTYGAVGANTKIGGAFNKLLGLAFAYGLTKNIQDAYEYLMDNYQQGDKVFLFGFSRGAFTVRALAGMLHKCGLLEKGSKNLIPYASKMYHKGDREIARGFKETFCRECKPHFIGVWDTVKSVGLIRNRKFANAKLNPDVAFGYHALSVDEKRSKFRPNLWDEPAARKQTIEQVWFAGVHSDVGGSYKERELSDITLRWMLDNAKKRGLLVSERADETTGDCTGKLHNSLLPIWWILGWKRRKIQAHAKIHSSVYNRMNKVDKYRPKNVPLKEGMLT